jgi:Cys-tRNA synthase (O-phospho-L-seryl-tRNA:Cys-tRNA synthase)
MLVNTSWDLGVRDMTSIALATIFIVVTGFARQATLSPVGILQKYQGK